MKNKYEEKMTELIEEFLNDKIITKYCSEYYRERADFFEEQIKNNEFRITVVGEFSAGKSTFLNALIGSDILPHGLTETTAAITYIHNVPPNNKNINKIAIHFNDENKPDLEFDIFKTPQAIKEYTTTQSKTSKVVNEISSVDIYINFRNIEGNIIFIDTPGLNGVADGHRDLTLREIQNAHASICLFHLRGIAKSDLEFIKILSKYQSSLLFVMNFIDEIKTTEGETYEKQIELLNNQLKLLLSPDSNVKKFYTFGVSSLKALASKDKSIKKLYSHDKYDLTEEERILLWKESRFTEFENFLWEYVASGEKNIIFEKSLKQGLQQLLLDLKDEMNAIKSTQNSNVRSEELANIKKRIDKIDEISQNNWNKVKNFIHSRKYDLECAFKKRMKDDLDAVLESMVKEVKSENFESIQDTYISNKYGNILQNKLSNLKAYYIEVLENILEEIYQSSILRAKQYNQNVSIGEDGVPIFIKEKIQPYFEKHKFEDRINKLREEKFALEYEKQNNQKKFKIIEGEIKELTKVISEKTEESQNVIQNLKQEKDWLGPEPEVRTKYETQKRAVERSSFSIFRLFGSEYKEKEVSVRVQDTSERDDWNMKQFNLKLKYSNQQNVLEEELCDIKERKRHFEEQKLENRGAFIRIDSRISVLEKDILRKKQDYEEIMSKAKSEYLKAEKERLIREIQQVLDYNNGKIYISLRKAMMENISSNISAIINETEVYYKNLQSKYKQQLNLLLQSEKKPIEQQEKQLKEINLGIANVDNILIKLNLIN